MKSKINALPILVGLAAALVLGVLTGYGRLLVWFFLPGIQGGVTGAVLGFVLGNLLAGRIGEETGFKQRLFMTVGLSLIFYGGQLLIPAFVLEGWDPSFLPAAILSGHFREVMTGASVNSYTVQQGALTLGWWFFFQIIDLLFFLFFGLLSLGMGLQKKRPGFAPWKPLAIVTVLCAVVLFSTVSIQYRHAGMLRDWQSVHGGGMRYLDLREVWVNAALREDRVRDFLNKSDKVSLKQIPQLGVLRALGYARLGELDKSNLNLSAAIESAKCFPGPIRIDISRKVSATAFIQYVDRLKQHTNALSVQGTDTPIRKIPAPRPDDLFPYEGILK